MNFSHMYKRVFNQILKYENTNFNENICFNLLENYISEKIKIKILLKGKYIFLMWK
jgi:hypothetical protein